MVARAVEEVRLTVKRGDSGGGAGSDGGNGNESGNKTMMPMPEGVVNTTKGNKNYNDYDSTKPQGQTMTTPIIPIESLDNIAKMRGGTQKVDEPIIASSRFPIESLDNIAKMRATQKVDEPIVASSRTEDSSVVTDVKMDVNGDEEDEWGAWKETQDVNQQQQQATIMTESSVGEGIIHHQYYPSRRKLPNDDEK